MDGIACESVSDEMHNVQDLMQEGAESKTAVASWRVACELVFVFRTGVL